MPRRLRHSPPGVTQHVVQRGADRQATFFGDADRGHYLGALREAAMRRRCDIHAYVLMTNHVHLLVTPAGEHAVSRMMQDLGRLYVRHLNDTRGRSGPLWEGRFRASLVGAESYVLACHRYIEENPVRAGMVTAASGYRWSSHGANATGAPDGLLTPHPTYAAIAADWEQRGRNYRALFERPLPMRETDAIRRALRKQLPYACEGFCEKSVKERL